MTPTLFSEEHEIGAQIEKEHLLDKIRIAEEKQLELKDNLQVTDKEIRILKKKLAKLLKEEHLDNPEGPVSKCSNMD